MAKLTARVRAPGDLGLALQQARLAKGLSQMDLARELDISQRSISEIESGKPTIYIRKLFQLLSEVEVELSASWEDPDVEPPDEARS